MVVAHMAACNLLAVVLDASGAYAESLSAEQPSQRLSFSQCLDHVITFLNSYLLLSQSNSVAVCLCHQGGSELVYPVAGRMEVDSTSRDLKSGKFEPLVHMNGLLRQHVTEVITSASSAVAVARSTLLSGGLSKALCYIQRCTREASVGLTVKPRILVIRAAPDMAEQHIATMNCLFAAQKQNIPVDSCVLWEESSYLQQASDVTGGLYIKVPEPEALLQFLLWVFLPDLSTQQLLSLPLPQKVDYRAACFCHHKLVELGHVCSVCLAISCHFIPICLVCQSRFKLPSRLPQPKKKKKSKESKHKSKS